MTLLEHKNETITAKDLAKEISADDFILELNLKDVKISGSDGEVSDLSRAIRGHPRIMEFSMVNVECLDAEVNLDVVVSMLLITCPKIEKLHLENASVTTPALSTVGYVFKEQDTSIPLSRI